MKKKIIIGIVLMLIAIGMFAGCTDTDTKFYHKIGKVLLLHEYNESTDELKKGINPMEVNNEI